MIHYPIDERLNELAALGCEKRHTNDRLGSTIWVSGSPRGKAGFMDANQLNHISCIINCCFGFFFCLSVVSEPCTELSVYFSDFIFLVTPVLSQLWGECKKALQSERITVQCVISYVSVVHVAIFTSCCHVCDYIWPLVH